MLFRSNIMNALDMAFALFLYGALFDHFTPASHFFEGKSALNKHAENEKPLIEAARMTKRTNDIMTIDC